MAISKEKTVSQHTVEKDKVKAVINSLTIILLAISAIATLRILMNCNNTKEFLWFPLSIIIVYVVFVIALILVLAIINKTED